MDILLTNNKTKLNITWRKDISPYMFEVTGDDLHAMVSLTATPSPNFELITNVTFSFASTSTIPGGFIKKGGKPRKDEIVLSRDIDRTFRCLLHRLYGGFNFYMHVMILYANTNIYKSTTSFYTPSVSTILWGLKEAYNINIELSLGQIDNTIFAIYNGHLIMISGNLNGRKIPELVDSIITQNHTSTTTARFHNRPICSQARFNTIYEYARSHISWGTDKLEVIFKKLYKNVDHFTIWDTIHEYYSMLERGRNFDEVRPISLTQYSNNRIIFKKGKTIIHSSLTYSDQKKLNQLVETPINLQWKPLIILYNREGSFLTGAYSKPGGRRETGHENLVESAFSHLNTSKIDGTILVSNDLLSEWAGTSTGACTATSALLYSIGYIKQPIDGITVGGLLKDNKYKYILDIDLEEDYYGAMDFKVFASYDRIYALQLDTKTLNAVPLEELTQVFELALKGIIHISSEIILNIKPDKSVLPYSQSINIEDKYIKNIIGYKGETIKGMEETYKVRCKVENDIIIIQGDETRVFEVMNLIKCQLLEFKMQANSLLTVFRCHLIKPGSYLIKFKENSFFYGLSKVEIKPSTKCNFKDLSKGFIHFSLN